MSAMEREGPRVRVRRVLEFFEGPLSWVLEMCARAVWGTLTSGQRDVMVRVWREERVRRLRDEHQQRVPRGGQP